MEETIPNCISFNGLINSEMTDVGGGYIAFNIIGVKGEEFPLCLVVSTLEEASGLTVGMPVSGVGILKKIQNQWCIEISSINGFTPEE